MKRFLLITFTLLVLGAGGGVVGLFILLHYFGRDLPEYTQLATYEPPVTTRIYAGDGRLLAEHAVENRLFVPIEVVPQVVKDAFLSAEDKNFYSHPGVDVMSIVRAVVTNVLHAASDRRPVGGSTITQQVAKNFLLGNEMSITRKIKEAILAFRIERAFNKERILELYLNEIYLGFRSYGVAAAAVNYFNKSVDDLSVAESAFLAALPKAPNNYNPITNPQVAKDRRDWVISRMLEDGRISSEQAKQAIDEPLVVRRRNDTEFVGAYWFAEEVRRQLVARFGEKALYEGGLSVRSTLDPKLQGIADRALREGLLEYDRRHGWRGPLAKIPMNGDWVASLGNLPKPPGLGSWEMALVTDLSSGAATIGFKDGRSGTIPMADMKWARAWREGERVGGSPSKPSDVLSVGDVVAVERGSGSGYALRQVPAVDGAVVAIDPNTGRVLAISGGFASERSEFNRATQAKRQPGSSFKPFVYLTALENGFTPSSMIMDAPIAIDQGPGLGLWKPKNYSGDFSGPATLRFGVEKSRNLMTVRLAEKVGIGKIAQVAEQFGIFDSMPRVLSMALGAGETTLLRLTTAYAELANGGKRLQSTLIDRVQDRTGQTVYRHGAETCAACQGTDASAMRIPEIPDNREQLADPMSVYQIVSIMQGVVERGTGTVVRMPGKPLAGKTGTTNDSYDTWFVGFSSDLAVGVFVGFDNPRTLGPKETGSSVAAPIFRDFMAEALQFTPARPFKVPPGIRLVRISRSTGLIATGGEGDVILEAFKPGTEPTYAMPVLGAESTETSPEMLNDFGASDYRVPGYGSPYGPSAYGYGGSPGAANPLYPPPTYGSGNQGRPSAYPPPAYPPPAYGSPPYPPPAYSSGREQRAPSRAPSSGLGGLY